MKRNLLTILLALSLIGTAAACRNSGPSPAAPDRAAVSSAAGNAASSSSGSGNEASSTPASGVQSEPAAAASLPVSDAPSTPAPPATAPVSHPPAPSSDAGRDPIPAPTSPAPDGEPLDSLRGTDLYQAVKLLNAEADFTNPNAYGSVRYNSDYLSADGFETAGGLPNDAKMKSEGMCCAAFVNYYLFNYLPNVKHLDPGVTWKNSPSNPANDVHLGRIRANSVAYTMEQSAWTCTYRTEQAVGRDYRFVGGDYDSGKLQYRIGDVLVFSCADYKYYHVAVYAGYYDGKHWLAHATNTPLGIGVTLSPFNGYSIDKPNHLVVYVTEIFTR